MKDMTWQDISDLRYFARECGNDTVPNYAKMDSKGAPFWNSWDSRSGPLRNWIFAVAGDVYEESWLRRMRFKETKKKGVWFAEGESHIIYWVYEKHREYLKKQSEKEVEIMEDGKKMSLKSKLVKAVEILGGLGKDGRNQAQQYNYVKGEDAMKLWREVEASLCIKVVASVVQGSISLTPLENNKGARSLLTSCVMEYTILDADSEEKLVFLVPAQGNDYGDKGIYKAMTGAFKYFVMQNFSYSTDDPEDEKQNIAKTSAELRKTPENKQIQVTHNVHDVDEKKLDVDDEITRGQIIKELIRLGGKDDGLKSDILEMMSEFVKDGQILKAGVRSPSELNYTVREGKKMSQAQVVLRGLKNMREAEVNNRIGQWRVDA